MMNLKEVNNDTKGIVEFPLTPKEIDVLRDIYSKIVVELKAEDTSRPEVLSAIIKIAPKVYPSGILKKLVENDEFQIIEDGGMIRFVLDEETEVEPSVIEKKEVKKMPIKREYKNSLTPSETRLAKKLFEAWKVKGISSGNAEKLCNSIKMRCNEKTLTTLTKRGLLEEKSGYYRIKYEVFE